MIRLNPFTSAKKEASPQAEGFVEVVRSPQDRAQEIELENITRERAQAQLDQRFDTAGFVDFLAQHRDNVEPTAENADIIEQRYEVFQVKENVKTEVKKLWAEEISQKVGIDMGADGLAVLDAEIGKRFDKEAIDSPEALLEFRDKLEKSRKLPEEIKNLEAQLQSLGTAEKWSAEIDQLTAKRENLLKVRDNLFTFGGIMGLLADVDSAKETYSAVKAVRKEGIPIHIGDLNVNAMDIEQRVTDIETVMDFIENAGATKEMSEAQLSAMRKDIFSGISASKEIADMLKKKVAENLAAMVREAKVDGSIDDVQLRFEELRKLSSEAETGIDLLSGTGLAPEEIQKKIDDAVERKAFVDVERAVKDFKLGDGNLTRLEEALAPILSKEKMGSKEGVEAKKIIKKAIGDVIALPGGSPAQSAKRILLERIRAKFRI